MRLSTPCLIGAIALLSCSVPSFGQIGSEAASGSGTRSNTGSSDKLHIHQPEKLEHEAVSTRFIVGLEVGSSAADLAAELRLEYDLEVLEVYERALVGLTVDCNLETAKRLAVDSRVRFVEQDIQIEAPTPIARSERGGQTKAGTGPFLCYFNENDVALNPYPSSMPTIPWGPNCPDDPSCIGNWGLDRIDDRAGLDGTYQPMTGTEEVDVYIVDTGVALNHRELSQTPVEETRITGEIGGFGPHYHGTHVAGIVTGKNFGVAQNNLRFHSMNFGGLGSFRTSTIVKAFEAVLNDRVGNNPAVVSLSGNSPNFPVSPSMSNVVRQAIAEKITVVNSAGNVQQVRNPQTGALTVSCDDALDPSESSRKYAFAGTRYPPEVLIAGATDDSDRVYCECDTLDIPGSSSFDCASRVGTIAVFAPGVDIVSMSADGNQSICRLSGTSMAAPHVAGAAALLLSRFPDASPGAIKRGLKRMSTKGAVRDHNGANVGSNRLLYVGNDYSSDKPVAGQQYFFARPGETLVIPKSQLINDDFDWQNRPLSVVNFHSLENGQLVDLGSSINFTVDNDAPLSNDVNSSASFRYVASNGIDTDTAKVRIIVLQNSPPNPIINYSGTGLERTFDARDSTDDRGIVSYLWTFPGGVQKSGPVVNHFFTEYGSNPFSDFEIVALTVTDTEGLSTTRSKSIFITAPGNVTPHQGLWHNPTRSGSGISLYANRFDQYVLTWYTYEANGKPIWYLSNPGVITNSTWSQPLYKVTWTGTTTSATVVGNVTVAFDDVASSGLSADSWFSWTLNGQSGGERFRYFHGGGGRSGLWAAPPGTGWGITVSDSDAGTNAMVNTVTFYEGSQPRWVQGVATSSNNAFVPMTWFNGPGLCPNCGGSTPPTGQSAGSIRVEIPSGSSATGMLSTSIRTPSNVLWNHTDIEIRILTVP